MKTLRQLGIIIIICILGDFIHGLLNIPIPGNVIGMILLFACLCTGIIKLEMIEDISTFLLKHLAFFFLPAGVALITCMHLIKDSWPKLLIICLLVTIIVMVITGHTVQLLKRSRAN